MTSESKGSTNVSVLLDFCSELRRKDYSFKLVGSGVAVTSRGPVILPNVKKLPKYTHFNNLGPVTLPNVKELHISTYFNNHGGLDLNSVKTVPEGFEFTNIGIIFLDSLKSLPDNVTFRNTDSVNMDALEFLHQGVTFNNSKHVNMRRLRTLPQGFRFDNRGDVSLLCVDVIPENGMFCNEGDVYLGSVRNFPAHAEVFHNAGRVCAPRMDGKFTSYRGDIYRVFHIGTQTVLMKDTIKTLSNYSVMNAEYVCGTAYKGIKDCYIVDGSEVETETKIATRTATGSTMGCGHTIDQAYHDWQQRA